MTHTSSKKEVPYLAKSAFTGSFYIVTKLDKGGLPLEKFEVTNQVAPHIEQAVTQALKELKEEVIGGVPSKMNTDNWKYDRRVAELKLRQHQAIDNKIKELEEV